MATEKNLGIVAPVPKGEWVEEEIYFYLNIVRYNKSTYIARKNNLNVQPEVHSQWQEYWVLLNKDGASGADLALGETSETAYPGDKGKKNEMRGKENSKEISNIYTILGETIIGTEEVSGAYSARVTANGLTDIIDGALTKVTEIKGSTVRCENLLPYPYNATSYVSEGVTWTVNSNGSITANGTATGNSIFVIQKASNFTLPAGTYTVSGANGGSQSTYNIQIGVTPVAGGTPAYYNATNGTKFTLSEPCKVLIQAVVYNGYNASGLTFYPMLNGGSSVKPFQPYFTDLKHTRIVGIKSTGRNLLDLSSVNEAVSGVTAVFDHTDGKISFSGVPEKGYINLKSIDITRLLTVGKTYTVSQTQYFSSYSADGAVYIAVVEYPQSGGSSNVGNTVTGKRSFTVNEGSTYRLVIQTGGSSATINAKIGFILNQGETALSFAPYTEDTYQLPQTLELELGDTFNPQTGELVKGTKTLAFTGDEDWRFERLNDYGVYNYYFAANAFTEKAESAICNYYDNDYRHAAADATHDGFAIAINGYIFFRTKQFSTAKEWAEHLRRLYAATKPLQVTYIKETPTVHNFGAGTGKYTAWKNGTETIEGNTNEEYGALPTIKNIYAVKKGV